LPTFSIQTQQHAQNSSQNISVNFQHLNLQKNSNFHFQKPQIQKKTLKFPPSKNLNTQGAAGKRAYTENKKSPWSPKAKIPRTIF
jgi:hypothetical protein